MKQPKKLLSYFFIGLILSTGIILFLNRQPIAGRPAPNRAAPHANYEYHRIIDEKTKKTLMTISSVPVFIGDELITDENKRYVVVKIEGNVAYARYVETISP